jgi:chorismate synthase
MSSFGTAFKVTTFGESHGGGVGCIIEGVPPRLSLQASDVQPQLNRRRPGQSAITTDRKEGDEVEILSGTENGQTLGSPICMLVRNKDHRPLDYKEMSNVPRPSHADFTYMAKYGINASSGGGRASARETIGRVAAGAVAEKWLKEAYGIEIVAFVSSVGEIAAKDYGFVQDDEKIARQDVDTNIVRCPHPEAAEKMRALIVDLKEKKDSTGGVLKCVVRGVPSGWGEPCFDKLEAKLAHAMLSIPSTKGFEIGSGFEGTKMRGSTHNDMFVGQGAKLNTKTNNSGGIQGGISNGQIIKFSVAFKPPATIGVNQETSNYLGEDSVLQSKGRHDPCVCPRAVPIVEAMAALCLADAALLQISREQASNQYEKIFNVK